MDNAGLVSCLDEAGLSIDAADDWSVADERDFASQPVALNCLLTEVGPGESLEGSMRRAFDDVPATEVMAVLSEFVQSRDGVDVETQARDVGFLLGALDPDEYDPGGETYRLRAQLAWDIHTLAEGESPVYVEWRDAHPDGRASGPAPDWPFLASLEMAPEDSAAGELYDPVADLMLVIDKAQEGDYQ